MKTKQFIETSICQIATEDINGREDMIDQVRSTAISVDGYLQFRRDTRRNTPRKEFGSAITGSTDNSGMGRSSSKLLQTPNSPLQEMEFQETQRHLRKRKQEKEQKLIAKLQQKHAKKKHKNKKNSKSCPQQQRSPSVRKRNSNGVQGVGRFNYQTMRNQINKSEFNRQIESKIVSQLDDDLCTFTMNQIALTLQFLGNYDSEISLIAEELLAKENELNHNLEEHSILLANPLDAAVAKWIRYKPLHGPDKHHSQLLQTQVMYVVFENIDIARPNDANYDSISALCKVGMETDSYKSTPCKEDYLEMLREIKWKGYVRLKLRENPKVHSSNGEEVVYTDSSSGYSSTSGYSTKTASMSSSGYESDYDYAYIAHLNTHHPMAELKMCGGGQRNLDTKVLPESCVASLGSFVDPCHEDDTDDEKSEDDSEDGYSSADEHANTKYKDYETFEAIRLFKIEQERRKVLLQQRYLNSKEFMHYFGELMRRKLAPLLPIPQSELEAGTYRGASIYTRQYEIIPAVHVAQNVQNWPDCAFQFRIRERPIVTNPLTGQQFQWPTRAMIKRIETFGFHVIPTGYAPKRQRNPFRELEWRIVFPKAERYLERHLTNAQLKVFMMTKALVKTFVEPQEKNKALMFAIDHLRMHLFWECERNFIAWPEEFLGEVLVRFISTFMQRLREKCLRDYFIEERNLFESIPEYSLVTLYSILADITANPLMHIMVAFRNIEFAENFFPKLNFKKIFENIVENDMMKLKMQAKNARSTIRLAAVDDDEPLAMVDEGAKGLVGMKQHREKTSGKLRRKTHLMRHNIEMKKKQEHEKLRLSMESIDVEFFFNKNLCGTQIRHGINQGVENLRRTNILEIMLDHLLAMAEKAVELRTVQLAKSYLAQARRLCKLYHNYGCDMGAQEYLASIRNIDEDVDDLDKSDDFTLMAPALPIRTSVEPVKSHKPKDLNKLPTMSKENLYVDVAPIIELTTTKINHSTRFNASESVVGKFEERADNIEIHPPKVTVSSPDLGRSIKLSGECETQIATIQVHRSEILVNSPEPRKSIKLSGESALAVYSTEPCKSIKFNGHVTEVHAVDTSAILKPEGYSPVVVQRFGVVGLPRKENGIIENEDAVSIDDTKQLENDVQKETSSEQSQNNDSLQPSSSSSLLNKFGTAAGILKNSPLIGSKVMKSITSSTEKVITNMPSVEEKRVQIREMLRRKTVQLKGAFN